MLRWQDAIFRLHHSTFALLAAITLAALARPARAEDRRLNFEPENWAQDIQFESADWASNIIRGQDEGGDAGADPSDPTQVTFHVVHEFEWNKLANNQGDTVAYKVNTFIPLNIGEQRFLASVEVPLTHAGTEVLGDHTGLGDIRMRYFWLIGTNHHLVRAWAPSFDVIAPTGDENKGVGNGAWILMPNVVFALQPADNLSIYPFFRYVHSDGPRPFLVPDEGIPAPFTGDADDESAKVRGFSMEVPIVFDLQDAIFDWISATPDYFQNFTGQRGHTFQMKYDVGMALSESLFFIFKFWHPVSGDVPNDFSIGIMLDWYPM